MSETWFSFILQVCLVLVIPQPLVCLPNNNKQLEGSLLSRKQGDCLGLKHQVLVPLHLLQVLVQVSLDRPPVDRQ